MDKVYGAYLCTGCGIGDALDVDALKETASEAGMEMQDHACLCGAEGRALIENDIAGNGVNTIVVCACSPRVMQKEFVEFKKFTNKKGVSNWVYSPATIHSLPKT